MKGKYVDSLPTGFFALLRDLLFGVRYYKVFRRCKYTGAALMADGYWRCPASRQEWLERMRVKHRVCTIEVFGAHTFAVEYLADRAEGEE